LCEFASGALAADPEIAAALLTSAGSGDVTSGDLRGLGLETVRTELEYNRRAGFDPGRNVIPDFLRTEPLPPTGATFDLSPEDLRGFWDELN
jgi:aldehyde:ferredoxin oxidoreductase